MTTKRVAVWLWALSLWGIPVASEASFVLTSQMPETSLSGVELRVSGGGGVCYADGSCVQFEPVRHDYLFWFGWMPATPALPAAAGTGPFVFDIQGGVGPTASGQRFTPYDLGSHLHGTLTATLVTSPLPGAGDEIFFAVATSTERVGGNHPPGAFPFAAVDGTHYYGVVFGFLSAPVSYRLTIGSAPATSPAVDGEVPEPLSVVLLAAGLVGSALAGTRRRRSTGRCSPRA